MPKINYPILFMLNSHKDVGEGVKKDEVISTIESVKAAGDVVISGFR